MSDDLLDDEAPPDIPEIASDPGAQAQAEAPAPPARAAAESDPGLDVDIDVEFPSDPGEPIEAVEVVEEASEPPRRRQRVQTNPATPIARASVPPPPGGGEEQPAASADSPAPAPSVPQPPPVPSAPRPPPAPSVARPPAPSISQPPPAPSTSQPPPAPSTSQPPPAPSTSQPPLAPSVAQPPPPPSAVQPPPPPSASPAPPQVAPEGAAPAKVASQPPRPVSQPPRPLSQPPRAKLDSEPPTEPYNPPPEQEEEDSKEGGAAATSYPPPPMRPSPPEAAADEEPPQSLKPMRMIRVAGPDSAQAAPPPAAAPAAARATPAAAAAPPPDEEVAEISDSDVAPASDEALEDTDISFPADETDDDVADELTEEDITPAAPGVAVIPADVDAASGVAADSEAKPAAPPPPPPRREARPVTPPSALDIKEAKEAQRAKQRKAWWEELFGEDFGRANARLKSAQITREADFIEESLGVAKGGVVLDLACGSGHHAVELAKRGYGVVGYDLSLYQLAVAADVAQDAGQKLNLLQGDMREMAFEEMFDGIYCWNTSFGYFEEEKNLAVAQRVFRALRPGGMFLIDVANRDFVVDHQPSQTWFEGDGSVCMDDMNVDFITSRLRVKRSLIIDDGRTLECAYSIRLYSLHELGKVLHDVGFRVTEASGHPATPGVFFGASSPRIIILAQRP